MKNRIFSLFGLFGPIVYLLFVLIAASQFPGYSHAAEYISNLGAIGQPSALIMNIGFITAGILILLFGIVTISTFKNDWKGLLGGIFISFEGLATMIGGIFPCEPGCNAADPILSETIHNSFGPIAYILFGVGLFLWTFRFRKQDEWDCFWIYTLVFAIAGVVFFVLFGMALETPTVGLWQRFLTGSNYLWMSIFSVLLWRKWDLSPFSK